MENLALILFQKKCQKSLWDPEGMVCQDQESSGIERGG